MNTEQAFAEMEKRGFTSYSKVSQVFSLLADGDWHDSNELNEVQHRFGASILVLRDSGCVIETKFWDGEWFYRFEGFTNDSREKRHRCPTCTCFSLATGV